MTAFQQRAEAARKQSDALFTSIVPIVNNEEREEWENYTEADPYGWIQEGLDYQEQWNPIQLGVSLPSFAGDVHQGYIEADDWELGLSRDESYGPYFPIWETSPLLKGMVNFNLGSLPQWKTEIAATMEKDLAVIGRKLTPAAGKYIVDCQMIPVRNVPHFFGYYQITATTVLHLDLFLCTIR